MKKTLLIAAIFTSIQVVNAQTTAQDWTLTDCSSSSHTLFNYLDAEEVVIMEFGMGCGSCYTAAAGLMYLKSKYAVEQPGKVNFFYMDYWTGNTCNGDVAPMLSAHAFDAGFINCSSQLAYYMSGSPMPGVVIVAGSNHLKIFEKNSYANADTTAMITAIDNFFATVGVEENDFTENNFLVYPNPAENNIKLSAALSETVNDVSVTVTDVTGKTIYSKNEITFSEGENTLDISIQNFEPGHYFIRIINNGSVIVKSFQKI